MGDENSTTYPNDMAPEDEGADENSTTYPNDKAPFESVLLQENDSDLQASSSLSSAGDDLVQDDEKIVT